MRVDIYRRAEADNKFSYLAVPEGRPIPEEATNTDWETEVQGIETDPRAGKMTAYAIDAPVEQIEQKGYAITSVKHLVNGAA